MGYSYTALAGDTLDALVKALKEAHGEANNGTNAWGDAHGSGGTYWFHELGRSHEDGRITGTIHRVDKDGASYAVGSFHIQPDGRIKRFSGTTKAMRDAAAWAGMHKYIQVHGFPRGIGNDHPAAELAHASFVAV